MRMLNGDIRHIMCKINPEGLLDSLGIRYLKGRYGDRNTQIIGYCPDHYFFTGKEPSHPKWYFNIETGQTYCHTESRGSNIVAVISRICDCSTKEAEKVLETYAIAPPSVIRHRIDQAEKEKGKPKEVDVTKIKELQSVVSLFEESGLYNRGYKYFAKDGINQDIVDEIKIVEVLKGKYRDRIIIPFRRDYDGVYIGFVAVCLQKKPEWVKQRVLHSKRFKSVDSYKKLYEIVKYFWTRYRKALYCKGAPLRGHLFGLRRLIEKGVDLKEVFLVEGERDAIKLQQEGFPALGTHGTHLTEEQVELLGKYGVEKVSIVFDGDIPGRTAATRVCRSLIKEKKFLEVNDIVLPEDKDPKNYRRSDFIDLIKRNKDLDKEHIEIKEEKRTKYGKVNSSRIIKTEGVQRNVQESKHEESKSKEQQQCSFERLND